MCAVDVPVWTEPKVRVSWSTCSIALAIFGLVLAPWLMVWWLLADLDGWPLNDDPFYAKPLAFWSNEGRIQCVRQYGYLTASSVAHIATGALASWSRLEYRQLYLVCMVQQTIGACAIYWFARRLQLSRTIAGLAAASLVTYPLYFGHAFTYMTDGPAAAWSSLACVALSIGLIRGEAAGLAVGAAAVGWGYWIRQTNGALLIAPCVALGAMWLSPSQRSRAWLAWPLALAILMIAALESGLILPSSSARLDDVAPRATAGYWKRALIALYGWCLLCGWYLLPLAPWLLAQAWSRYQRSPRVERCICHGVAACMLLAGCLVMVLTAGRAHLTSATGSFIQNGHFGPIFLSDMDEPGRWGELSGVQWPTWIWQALSLLAIVSSGALAWWASWTAIQTGRGWLTRARQPLLDNASAWLIMLGASVMALTLLIEPHLDRYWLFLMPVLSVICLSLAAQQQWKISRAQAAWGCGCVVLQLAMSTVFVHDMLAWNNARWQFVNAHLAAGHAAETIDAGRDVNAWLRMDEDPDTSARPGDESRWWSGRAFFCIASGSRPGWRLHTPLPWDSWATGRTHYLLVLERCLPNG